MNSIHLLITETSSLAHTDMSAVHTLSAAVGKATGAIDLKGEGMNLERLREVRHLQKEIEDLSALRETLYHPIRSPKLTSEGGHGTTPGNPTERAVSRIMEVDEKINAIQNKLAAEISEILDWLYNDLQSSELRSIIICHYLEGMTWKQTTRHVLGGYDTESARIRVHRYFNGM